MTLDEDSLSFGVVTGIDLTAFLGRGVSLLGDVEDDTLYARELTIGAITVQDVDGAILLGTAGVVERAGDVYQMVVEGITLTLDGGERYGLDERVGESIGITGSFAGSWVSLTAVSP